MVRATGRSSSRARTVADSARDARRRRCDTTPRAMSAGGPRRCATRSPTSCARRRRAAAVGGAAHRRSGDVGLAGGHESGAALGADARAGATRPSRALDAVRSTLEASGSTADALRAQLDALGERVWSVGSCRTALTRRLTRSGRAHARRPMVRRDGLRRFCSIRRGMLFADRLPDDRRGARPRAATTCWRPKRGWRASSPSPRATCRRALVPAGPPADAGGHGLRR